MCGCFKTGGFPHGIAIVFGHVVPPVWDRAKFSEPTSTTAGDLSFEENNSPGSFLNWNDDESSSLFFGARCKSLCHKTNGCCLYPPNTKANKFNTKISDIQYPARKKKTVAESLHVSCMDCGLSKRGITWRTGATRGFKLSHRELRRPCQRWSPQWILVFLSMLVTANLLSRRFHHSQ